ncbi:MAG: hypothetical protein EHM59_01450, partial [Betaproteobacteria bacterium]
MTQRETLDREPSDARAVGARHELPGQAVKPADPATALSVVAGLRTRATGQAGAEPLVEIDSGKLRGRRENGVYTFKGVPYAA